MKTGTGVLLAATTCVVGLVSAFLLQRRTSSASAEVATGSDPLAVQPPSDVESTTWHLETPGAREPMVPEPTADPATPTSSVEPRSVGLAVDAPDPRTLPEGTLAEMQAKREAIDEYLRKRTPPIFEQRFADGLQERVADGPTYSRTGVSELERTSIYALRAEPGGPWYRTVLPRWQYPELYIYKDDSVRLEKLIWERRLDDAKSVSR